jgi:hypothetical protein
VVGPWRSPCGGTRSHASLAWASDAGCGCTRRRAGRPWAGGAGRDEAMAEELVGMWGRMGVGLGDPCDFGCGVGREGKYFGASPAELTWEARFGLLKWAWLRGIIRMTWVLPGCMNRSNKQRYLGRGGRFWIGPVYQTHFLCR